MLEKIKKWYRYHYWNIDMIRNAVRKNLITQKDADEILK